jgi:ATP-dependent DNA helicase RecQ
VSLIEPLPDPLADPLAGARETLRRVFGHPDFRGLQGEVIAEILAGRDALAILPTGGGKSMCYQVPALLREGVAVVVSPLIALMQDQVATLRDAGVRAGRLDSSLPPAERLDVLASLGEGMLDLLYVSPEGLMSGAGLDRLRHAKIALIAIDEAHCVSQWGHDFRPDYRGLGRLAELFPGAPRLAVTATADRETQADIRRQLKLEHARTFVASFDRPNLALSAERKVNPQRRIVDLALERKGQAGIVYAGTRDATEQIAAALDNAGVRAFAYHAGLDPRLREERQHVFQNEDDVVMSATIAFGMGVDKPDVRFVIHADAPRSIEAYWQEVGRAGRDGAPAEGIALYGAGDLRRSLRFIEDGNAEPAIKAAQARKSRQLFAFLDGMTCRRAGVRRYFGEENVEPCGVCDICLDPPASVDATEWAAKAISAVLRTDQRFGRARVIAHLMGRPAQNAADEAYASKSTYGIGADVDEAHWKAVFDQLLFDGMLVEGGEDMRPVLRVADDVATRAVFRKEREVRIREVTKRAGRRTPEERRAARAARKGVALNTSPLFTQLRAWRRETAEAQNVPPYVIFHDATLSAIADAKPKTLPELGRISGVGEAKLKRYGADVVALCLLDGA